MLFNRDASKALPRYFSIFEGRAEPFYLKAKDFRVEVDLKDDDSRLWRAHSSAVREFKESKEGKGSVSLLDLKLELAKRIFQECIFCERRCTVNRMGGKSGHCGVLESKVASEFLHWGEEPELVPSYTIFFSGCTFNCVFCQNWDISQFPDAGVRMSPEKVARMIESREARNVNWVGGEPTPNLLFILQVLKECSANLPQVWNSNMYMSAETMNLLDGVADLYLADFKYGNDDCAKRLSNVKNYWNTVTRNHKIANQQCEIIIRHLVMPNHVECCSKPVLKWIADSLELKRVRVNVMAQYRPQYRAYKYDDLAVGLSGKEFKEAYGFAEDLGLNLVD